MAIGATISANGITITAPTESTSVIQQHQKNAVNLDI